LSAALTHRPGRIGRRAQRRQPRVLGDVLPALVTRQVPREPPQPGRLAQEIFDADVTIARHSPCHTPRRRLPLVIFATVRRS
jgi:hypothetical protein